MLHHTITGGGGLQLHVVETGNPHGRPVLFIHGISQCWLSWQLQLNSTLAAQYRLVALDLRGHGLSGTPRDGYGDTRLWADDIEAVVRGLALDRPVLCGWSYGPLVILDYIRHYGAERLGGIVLVDGITKLGSAEAASVLTPEFLSIVPSLFAGDVEESTGGLRTLLRMCLASDPEPEERYLMLGYSVSVPPYVRQALLSRAIDNDDLMPKLRATPVLIVHGESDAIVKVEAVAQHTAALPQAQVAMIAGAGHAPFRDRAATFNEQVRTFCERLDVQAV